MRRVLKFGGTSIADAERVRRAAETVKRLFDAGEQVAVVLSAQGNDTNVLLDAAYGVVNGGGDPEDIYRIALLGEEKSVRLMCAALKALRVPAVPFIPSEKESWPIIIDSDDHSPIAQTKINEERSITLRDNKTAHRFKMHVSKHLRLGRVPVIAGFFALSSNEHLVTLGRGGTDITAFIVGRYIGADEVVIVTDVEGVLSGDPRILSGTKLIQELSVEDLMATSSAGSRVVHPRALIFKSEEVNARIVDYKHLGELKSSGTTILGSSQSSIARNPRRLSFVTLVGSNLSREAGLLAEVAERLAAAKITINSLVATDRFIMMYLEDQYGEEAHKILHALVLEKRDTLQNITIKGDIGEIRLRSSTFIEEPGVLAEITGILSARRINVIEIVTSLSDVYVYVSWKDLAEATEALEGMVSEDPGLFQ